MREYISICAAGHRARFTGPLSCITNRLWWWLFHDYCGNPEPLDGDDR